MKKLLNRFKRVGELAGLMVFLICLAIVGGLCVAVETLVSDPYPRR